MQTSHTHPLGPTHSLYSPARHPPLMKFIPSPANRGPQPDCTTIPGSKGASHCAHAKQGYLAHEQTPPPHQGEVFSQYPTPLGAGFPTKRRAAAPPPPVSLSLENEIEREGLVFYCRTTSASTAPCTSRKMCCHPERYAALRIVLVTVPRVSRSCEHFPDGFDLHPLHS